MTEEKNKEGSETEKEVCTAGWDAITEAFEKLYPGQDDPKHYGVILSWNLGGNDPLDGISVYDGGDYWHFVTYGLSELYEKECENPEYSGYGVEFTFKLKKANYEDEEGEFRCICGILQAIARMTFEDNEQFRVNEYLYTGQTEGIDSQMKSNITGFITMAEPKVPEISTLNGKVEFVEFIGATDAELRAIQEKKLTVVGLQEKLGTDVTSYERESVI